jgi:mono/diheme cytochrome c family protein
MKTKNKALLFGAGAALAAVITFGSVVWGGVATVAGTDPHYASVEWMLKTTMRSSVRHHAADIEVPTGIDLLDPELAERAFGHYSVACTPCHGAPGVDAAPWLVLNPPAESLVETADRWNDAELYWIVKHGIKMTGMPALGPTHGEDDLWAIAAFVRQLPEMSAQAYGAMAERHAGHGHDHGAMAVPAAGDERAADAPVEIVGACDTPAVSPAAAGAEPPATAPSTEVPARSRRDARRRPTPTRTMTPAPTPTEAPPPAADPAPAHAHHRHHGGAHQ